RGAAINPPNRFEPIRLEVLGEHLDRRAAEAPGGTQVPTRVFEDDSRTIINKVDSEDIPFAWTVNPYRGCEHGCVYCYARPGHEYFGLSLGVDFETKIFAKPKAAERLRQELDHPRWRGEPVVMSGVTDPYQPVERDLKITRSCLRVMADRRQPVAIVTKSGLVTRDIDLLRELARFDAVRVAVSLTTLDNDLASKMEPRAGSPRERLETIRRLSESGIPVGVMTAPIIPGLNDHEIPALLEAARHAGARHAAYVMLRLPFQIKDLFLEWLGRHMPARAAKIESLVRDTRGGELYDARPFVRMKGQGPYAEQIQATFEVFARNLGLARRPKPLSSASFMPGGSGGSLFGSVASEAPSPTPPVTPPDQAAGHDDQPTLLG
ncbi:MAG TPA: PA0069 family radical SAM protein, partial [Phycisphaerales bacterium]|nr:PA0069 family radical SAM protein [Phycisphaerales bacterium]